MSAPTYANILLQTQTQMDAIMQSFTFEGYQALAEHLRAPIGSLCVLYIVLTGYGMLLGYVKTPIAEFKKICLRIGVVYMFALNWGVFSQYFLGLFIEGSNEMGNVLMKLAHFDIPNISGSGISGGLQSVLIEVIRVGQWVIDQATLRHWSPAFTGIAIDLAGIVVIGFAFFELIVAKLMLSVCLCFAPLFFIFTLFDATKSFFDRWLGMLVGFALVLIFVSSIVGLCMHLIHITISPHYLDQAANVTFSDWIPIVLMAVLCVMALLEVTSIAKSIGGACSTSNGSAMVGGFIGGALGASRTTQSGSELVKAKARKGLSAIKHAQGGITVEGNSMHSIQNKIRGGQ